MNTYSFTCTCGDKITAQASSKDEAVQKILETMKQTGASHMAEKHPGQSMPPADQWLQMVQSSVVEVPAETTPPASGMPMS